MRAYPVTFESLLRLIPKEADRQKLRDLAREFSLGRQAPGASRGEQALDQIMHQIQLHFRAIRHPLPGKQEVEQMLLEHSEEG
jgi:hypothetical protein